MSTSARYGNDFYTWTQEQGRLLEIAAKTGTPPPLDFENLAEEVYALGRTQKRAIQWALTRVIEYLLKLEHAPDGESRSAWEEAVIANRFIAADALGASPSLINEIDFVRAYRDGRRMAMVALEADPNGQRRLPVQCPYPMDKILNENWWPENRCEIVGA